MALSVTVAGVERASYCQRFSTRRGINAIGTGTFTFVDEAASPWTPTVMEEVIVTVDAVVVFRGRILTQAVEWAVDFTAARTTANVVDVNDRANLELLNVGHAGPAKLRAVLTTIMGNLSAQGVSLGTSPTAGEGPDLGDQLFAWVTCREALDHLATLTGYVWRISESLALEMWSIGSRSSGLSFNQANANIRTAQWSQDVSGYRNIQWLVYGPTQANVPVSETWQGDGSTRLFPMSYALNGGTPPNVITRSDVPETVPCGPDTSWEWSFDSVNSRIVHTGGTVLPFGATLSANYQPNFPQYVVRSDAAEVAARGRWMKKDEAPDIVDFAAAAEYADALIRANTPRPMRLSLQTLAAGADPGETCVVTVPSLDIANADYLIEAVAASYRPIRGASAHVQFTLELIGGSERQAGWQDFWVDLIKKSGGAGGGVSGGVSGGGSTGGGVGAMYLGGSRSRSVQADAAGPPAGSPVVDYLPVTLDSGRYPSGTVTVRVEVKSRAAGTTVTPKLVCLDTNAVVGSGAATASTTWEAQTFVGTLVSGVKRYALYLVGSNGTNEVLGIGYLE